jgi:probable phosphoglycerate mutase
MTTIFLARHGAHDRLDRILCGRMAGVSLSSQGVAQAERLAVRLSKEAIDALCVSPLERARETAAPVAEALGLHAQVVDALNEVDVGAWTGATFESLKRHPDWASWNAARGQVRPPGGESLLEVQVRVARWITQAAEAFPDGRVVGVCHADVVKAALCLALGLSLDHHHRLEVGAGSLSVLEVGRWGMKTVQINETPP